MGGIGDQQAISPGGAKKMVMPVLERAIVIKTPCTPSRPLKERVNEMKKEELSYRLGLWKQRLISKKAYGWNVEDADVYNKIAALIKKEVTEEWIEMRAWRLRDLIAYVVNPHQGVSPEEGENKLKDFIHSLVEELSK